MRGLNMFRQPTCLYQYSQFERFEFDVALMDVVDENLMVSECHLLL